jgi:hypothetical protein
VIHYHGGPITPETAALRVWKGRHAFISFAHASQLPVASEVCQSFAIDNGAFSTWKKGGKPAWEDYYSFVGRWINHPRFDFAVIPDVIEGTVEENDELLNLWPHPAHKSLAVWHTNEPIGRLKTLAKTWPRVGIGSSGEYDVRSPKKFLQRAKLAISHITDDQGFPWCKLHGLRMLNPEIFTQLPLSSADAVSVALNIGLDKRWKVYDPRTKEGRAQVLVERIEFYNSASRLTPEYDL